MEPQVLSGSRVTVSFNDETVAAGHVVSYTLDTRSTEIETIDNVFPAELAPERIRVSLNIKVYRTPDNDPVLLGYAPGGSKIGLLEQSNFLKSKYLVIEIKDNNDQTVLCIPKAWINTRSASVAIHDIFTESWSITGIGFFGRQN